jgi:hypothetical protein
VLVLSFKIEFRSSLLICNKQIEGVFQEGSEGESYEPTAKFTEWNVTPCVLEFSIWFLSMKPKLEANLKNLFILLVTKLLDEL